MAEIKIDDLNPTQQTQVRDGIGALKNDAATVQTLLGGANAGNTRSAIGAVEATNTAINTILAGNPSATRTTIGALESNASAVQTLIGGANASATRTAIGACGNGARIHINHNVPFMALRNSLQNKLSTDIVIFGDSTGVGQDTGSPPVSTGTRWAYKLAQAITAAYPDTGVSYYQISNDANKVWTETVLRASTGLSGLYTYPTTISPWASGQTYEAGTFVTTVIGSNTYKWFCRKTHTSSSENQPSQTSTPEFWTGLTNQPQYELSLQACPLFYGSGNGTDTSTAAFEIELELTFQLCSSTTTLFATGYVAGSKDTIRLDQAAGTASYTLYVRPTAGAGYIQFPSNTALPFSNGERVRLKVRLIPDNGANALWEYSYSKFTAGSWGAWQTHYSGSTTPRTWCVAQGPILVYAGVSSGSSPAILHAVTVRKRLSDNTTWANELDASVDQYGGYGSGGLGYFGMPKVRIWNVSWSGSEIKHFADLADIPLLAGGTTTFDWDKNIPSPSNAQLVFVNFGHNGHMIPMDIDSAAVLRRLTARIHNRFPRANICFMSQNPGINGYLYGTPPNTHLNYAPYEFHKCMKKAYEAQACLQDGHGFIDVNRAIVESGMANSYSNDGLHPNEAGSIFWSNILYKAITGTLDV